MRRVSCAITARIAVEERASKECFRHQGYATAIQKASKPACSQAFARATVSRTGSMLSWRTPMLKGMSMKFGIRASRRAAFGSWLADRGEPRLYRNVLIGIFPGVLQAFDQFPQRFVQRCGDSDFVAPLYDRAIHKVDLGLALREHILQHAGTVLTRSVGALLHQLARIA